MDLIPLEDDLLSLELDDNFAHHLLQDDDSYKVYVQYSIHRLEAVFGRIEHKFGLGKTSKQIITRIEKNTLNIDQANAAQGQDLAEIDAMIMIDRDVDLISPFCVSQNYEGLLDEFFSIKTCVISVPNTIVYPDEKVREELKQKEDGSTEFILTNEDVLFGEIRNKHFNMAGPTLNRQIKEIQRMMQDKSQNTIQELDKFIKKLKNMNVVKAKEIATCHINIAHDIAQRLRKLDYIHIYGVEGQCVMGEVKEVPRILEAKMLKQYDKLRVLRALVLLSSTQGGLAKTDFDSLRRSFLMNYGHHEIVTLMNLQDAGLLKVKDKKAPGYFDWNWEKIKTALDLLNEECNMVAPSDISFVFNGFCPLSVRLIERILDQNGMATLAQKGIFKLLGLTDDKIATPPQELRLFTTQAPNGVSLQTRAGFKKKKILVYFVGGVTYGEIAAIRFLQNLMPKFRFIIATTTIITGQRAISQLLGPQENGLLLTELLKN